MFHHPVCVVVGRAYFSMEHRNKYEAPQNCKKRMKCLDTFQQSINLSTAHTHPHTRTHTPTHTHPHTRTHTHTHPHSHLHYGNGQVERLRGVQVRPCVVAISTQQDERCGGNVCPWGIVSAKGVVCRRMAGGWQEDGRRMEILWCASSWVLWEAVAGTHHICDAP